MSYSPGQNYRLSYTVAIALAAHTVIIFWLAFNAESKANPARAPATTAAAVPTSLVQAAQRKPLGNRDIITIIIAFLSDFYFCANVF